MQEPADGESIVLFQPVEAAVAPEVQPDHPGIDRADDPAGGIGDAHRGVARHILPQRRQGMAAGVGVAAAHGLQVGRGGKELPGALDDAFEVGGDEPGKADGIGPIVGLTDLPGGAFVVDLDRHRGEKGGADEEQQAHAQAHPGGPTPQAGPVPSRR